MPVAAKAAREHSQGEQPLRVSVHLASCGKRGALAGDLVVTRGQQEPGICLQGDAGDLPARIDGPVASTASHRLGRENLRLNQIGLGIFGE